jgi:RNA recognition motif-containing protein
MRLYVGNLPFKANETDLQAFFSQAGVTVDNVSVMRDKFSGEARGFGFVEITDNAEGEKAVNLCNGRELMGRALVINEARPMSAGGGGGGGGRERRGGGGGGGRGGYDRRDRH